MSKKKDSATQISRKDYDAEMTKLQAELVAMQEWVKRSGARIVIVLEGRDTAGKGGVIKRIRERTSPRVFREVALPAPSDREKSQMYMQRYMAHLPAAGEVVIFDRSWYNRAGVEKVMGFSTPAQVEQFYRLAPVIEEVMVKGGILLLKYWLEISAEEQTKRLKSRIEDPRKGWKLSPMDVKSYSLWYEYSRARDAMFEDTSSPWAPWYVVDNNNKKRGRLNLISHLLSKVPYEQMPEQKVTLPPRQVDETYIEPDHSALYVEEKY